MTHSFVIPVLPSADIPRDVNWYEKHTGLHRSFRNDMYCGLVKDGIEIHLPWHANSKEDPLLGGSVIKIFVEDIRVYFDEFVARGTVASDKLRLHLPWQTHEFGFLI